MSNSRIRSAGRTAAALLILATLLAACSDDPPSTTSGPPEPVETVAEAPTTSTDTDADAADAAPAPAAAGMSVLDMSALVVMTALPGGTPGGESAEAFRERGYGGAILFGYNLPAGQSAGDLRANLRSALGPETIVSIDQEGGPNRHLDGVAPSQSAGSLGATGDTDLVEREYRDAASQLLERNTLMNLAPVADLDLPPRHVMRGRAFGSDPEAVAEMVAAAVRGAHAGGGMATLKHFPGLGAGTANTDDGPSTIDVPMETLRAREFLPFIAGIEAGAGAVMTTHSLVPAMDPELPASISPAVHDVLRDELGFDGVIITDSLNARGLTEQVDLTTPQRCAAAIAAGADIALVTGDLETARLCARAIQRGVEDGSIPEARLVDAASRVLGMPEWPAAHAQAG